jgi:hypothetical protein
VTRSLISVSLLGAVLLVAGGCTNPVRDDQVHRTFASVVITAEDGQTVYAQSQGRVGWEQGITLSPGETLPVRVFFVDETGTRFQLPHGGAEYTLHVASANPAVARYEPVSDQAGRLVAVAAGATSLTVHLWHGVHPQGHPDASVAGLAVEVAAAGGGS